MKVVGFLTKIIGFPRQSSDFLGIPYATSRVQVRASQLGHAVPYSVPALVSKLGGDCATVMANKQ